MKLKLGAYYHRHLHPELRLPLDNGPGIRRPVKRPKMISAEKEKANKAWLALNDGPERDRKRKADRKFIPCPPTLHAMPAKGH